MATKSQLYETRRAPSRMEPLGDDRLSVWRTDPSDKNGYLEASINEVRAPKTVMVWKSVLSTLLDPNQIHIRTALGKMVTDFDLDSDPDKEVQKMITSLESGPPVLTLFEFRPSSDSLAVADMHLRSRVFLCSKLSSALERIENNILLETQLKYLIFNALLHEMGHWLNYDPILRKTSGPHLRYRDWYGQKVDIGDEEGRQGEAGYFLEGELWGGIIEYSFPHKGITGKEVKGVYQKPNTNTLRAFEKIGLIVRHPGDVDDTKREQIPLEAMTKRLTRGTIIKGFADNELVPIFAMYKDSKEVWSIEDPLPRTNPEDEGKRRSKRRKLNPATLRSRLAIIDLDTNFLYATAEFLDQFITDAE